MITRNMIVRQKKGLYLLLLDYSQEHENNNLPDDDLNMMVALGKDSEIQAVLQAAFEKDRDA